ncbi:hypothetical protein BDV28DRAFT_162289 [Aspergillus coremiiformis]|uniref:Uncharacterized protein n=1 Tax=Aspergillus coremiiformis TaxID=138285 RepID=A0A5N6ZES0_9EURO|nr:hypothetical protein BDV28DRAFT_162289 [Aspergillus coremiiformis]
MNAIYPRAPESMKQPNLVGWTPEPTGRGTLGLITTSLTTIFLCTWVIIHPRVYQNQLLASLHKLALFLKAIIAPELIAVEGFQEWAQCRRMVEDCAEFTKGEFTLAHAYYISMLALRYRTANGDKVIWPNQYTWLLQQQLVDWEQHAHWGLSVEDLWDKSKSDSLAKLVALSQVSWFVAQCIMRGVYGLPLSQIEAMSLGYIPFFMVTYFFWWHKPKDIRSPSLVELPEMSLEQRQVFESMAVSEKFDNEGKTDQVGYWNTWYLTPRVFEKEEEDQEIQKARGEAAKIVVQGAVQGHQEHSLHDIAMRRDDFHDIEGLKTQLRKERVVAHWDPHLYRSQLWPVTCLFGVCFGALHLACWNTAFPTVVEVWLWRSSAFVSMISMLVFMHFEKVVLRWGGPLTMVSIVSPGFYILSRIVMLGEVFAALRAVESGVYETYDISNEWIHL